VGYLSCWLNYFDCGLLVLLVTVGVTGRWCTIICPSHVGYLFVLSNQLLCSLSDLEPGYIDSICPVALSDLGTRLYWFYLSCCIVRPGARLYWFYLLCCIVRPGARLYWFYLSCCIVRSGNQAILILFVVLYCQTWEPGYTDSICCVRVMRSLWEVGLVEYLFVLSNQLLLYGHCHKTVQTHLEPGVQPIHSDQHCSTQLQNVVQLKQEFLLDRFRFFLGSGLARFWPS
jgi:hypothetical protein